MKTKKIVGGLSLAKFYPELRQHILITVTEMNTKEGIDRWAEHDAAGALGLLDQCISQGYSLDRFCDAMIDQLRTLMLIAVCGPDTVLVDVPAQHRAEIGGVLIAKIPVFLQKAIDDLLQFSRTLRIQTHRSSRCLMQNRIEGCD
jgi:DNA polymerase III gamma/tau subunit